ncbi:hypothetical protein N7478_001427 [Penicillium angulare]|uniref:uncharacterized protein n=1 Tax=Penicillium angulare TaxID=116970 RepID=UPI002540B0F1|nr:uncharacterized protein N7478_001427 [Penicillium angulare]KAJ5292176.1 hypothetical protein N7478_001427 [Penicillium angulare]
MSFEYRKTFGPYNPLAKEMKLKRGVTSGVRHPTTSSCQWSSLEEIEKLLPTELIRLIILILLDSHDGLHTIQELFNEGRHLKFVENIDIVLSSRSTHNFVHDHWKLHTSCSDLINCISCKESCTREEQPEDLVSWTVKNCIPCLNILIKKAIRPLTFNARGYGLLWVAFSAGNEEAGAFILSSMRLDEFFQPINIGDGQEKGVTVIQASTWRRRWFELAWDRIQEEPGLDWACFGPEAIQNVAWLADIGLASSLFCRGLDLGAPDEEDQSPGWYAVLRKDNTGNTDNTIVMWEWFAKRHQPPQDLIVCAVMDGKIAAVKWLLSYVKAPEVWHRVLMAAADVMTINHAELLEILLEFQPLRRAINKTDLENTLIDIVRNTCQKSTMWIGTISEQSFLSIPRKDSVLEDIAVRKIQAIGRCGAALDVLGLAVQSEEAGLHRITEALSIFSQSPASEL